MEPGLRARLHIEYLSGPDSKVIYCEMFMAEGPFLEAKHQGGAKFAAGPLDGFRLPLGPSRGNLIPPVSMGADARDLTPIPLDLWRGGARSAGVR
jgi:hypothetical protein